MNIMSSQVASHQEIEKERRREGEERDDLKTTHRTLQRPSETSQVASCMMHYAEETTPCIKQVSVIRLDSGLKSGRRAGLMAAAPFHLCVDSNPSNTQRPSEFRRYREMTLCF